MNRQRWMLGVALALLGSACSRTELRGGLSDGASGSATSAGGSASPSGGGSGEGGVGATSSGGGAAGHGQAGAPSDAPLELSPETLPRARVRWGYSTRLNARGGHGPPYSYELLQGRLPRGLELSAGGGLTGTPSEIGDYPLRLRATDARGNRVERDYELRVLPPRFMAYGTFLSSSSTRTALHLADLLAPGLPTYTLADGSPGYSAFSPDGRWFAFCAHVAQGDGELYVVDTSGEAPGPLLPLLEPGQTSPCAAWVWSPDGRRLAYVRGGSLWLATLNEAGVAERTQAVQAASARGLSWPSAEVLFFRDDQGRANLLRLDARGRFSSPTPVDAEQSTLSAIAPGGELAFATSETGHLLVDAKTGGVASLGHWPAWLASPTLELLLGRSSTGDFALYAPKQATLPAPLRVGAVGAGPSIVAFASTRAAAVQREDARLVITEVQGDAVQSRAIEGAYDALGSAQFDSRDRMLVFTDRASVWGVDTTEQGPLTARVLSQLGPNAQNRGPFVQLGRSTPHVLAGGGTPYALRLIDLEQPLEPLISTVPSDLSWAEAAWSKDDVHLAILGGSPALGRVLLLVAPGDPREPTRVSSCNGRGDARPRCPGLPTFQP